MDLGQTRSRLSGLADGATHNISKSLRCYKDATLCQSSDRKTVLE
ncbi:hypothetical protein BP1258A_0752 [Burkholderia pseudomallei 1258a]|uniref:Uncharacterized protein n=1 Tax=Burkholderia pseudomallei (strain 1026b) TaxID=884204 RepID=A0A0H3HHZ9_BURP2|nr:hypothetical protein BP1026B_I0914 [Burkholderia pseudomallei 1026b]EIF67406.1 hypothetical protein BP1026A_0408 [Burkholderia pseudomallei 1026a]EIF68158.1 hypothetical protein BP1258A_0752 [Burkholderia pseudomallei 1258a]EIF70163.1 hypothetical protein BP1258B_0845 [Burkholderia pseudomallei 1258b]EIF77778.1 hypothetical protein BP354E_0644 [Burkholderia pseudomallei 354e]EIF81958.1 hypothetical protein BP354A_0854 [Burkholderia pseudomallei 354a]KOS95446.1 hypothetical protein DM49_212